MIKSLLDAEIRDGTPRILGEQPWVKALSLAVLELHRRTMDYIDGSQIYTAIDTVREEVLDALAVNWKIDWYDTEYDLEQKRRIVKTALTIRRTMGTAAAVKAQADAIYPGSTVEEWFEYGSTPGHFRLRVNIMTVEEQEKFAAMSLAEGERRLGRQSGSAPTWRKWNTTTREARQQPGALRPTRGRSSWRAAPPYGSIQARMTRRERQRPGRWRGAWAAC